MKCFKGSKREGRVCDLDVKRSPTSGARDTSPAPFRKPAPFRNKIPLAGLGAMGNHARGWAGRRTQRPRRVMTVRVHGTCAPGFEGVREEFERNFAERGELGASVAATVDGEFVVDLWGGDADKTGTRAWERDSLVNVYSTTKGMTALCAHLLTDRGELDLDKADIPVRWLLSHRSGVIAPREPMTSEDLYDWDKVCGVLAATPPWWKPGTAQGYHAVSYGYLVGEVVRRITGVSLGTFLRSEVTGPLGADVYVGTPESEHGRCADLARPITVLRLVLRRAERLPHPAPAAGTVHRRRPARPRHPGPAVSAGRPCEQRRLPQRRDPRRQRARLRAGPRDGVRGAGGR